MRHGDRLGDGESRYPHTTDEGSTYVEQGLSPWDVYRPAQACRADTSRKIRHQEHGLGVCADLTCFLGKSRGQRADALAATVLLKKESVELATVGKRETLCPHQGG